MVQPDLSVISWTVNANSEAAHRGADGHRTTGVPPSSPPLSVEGLPCPTDDIPEGRTRSALPSRPQREFVSLCRRDDEMT